MSSHRYQPPQPPRPPHGPNGRYGPPPPPNGPQPPQRPRKGHPWLWGSLASGGALVFGLVAGVALGAAPQPAAADPQPTVTATEVATVKVHPTVTETQKVKVTKTVRREPKATGKIPGDGVFLVGDDVKPGTYRGKPAFGGSCYWARLSDASGSFDAIIANDNITGPSIVTVNSGEYFKTRGCATWKRQ